MIAEAVARHLATKGHGAFDDVESTPLNPDIFFGFQPDQPDNCITVYDTTAPTLPESQAFAIDQVGIQVLIRNTSYTAARDIAMSIHRDLVGFGGASLAPGTPRVSAIYVETAPTSVGRDEHTNSRAEWSAHYRLRIESEGDLYRA